MRFLWLLDIFSAVFYELIYIIMLKEMILGTAESLSELLILLNKGRRGVIVLDTMVDCGDCRLNCYSGIVLRGKDNTCGLNFTMDVFEEPVLRMHQDSRIENLTLEFRVNNVSPDANFGCILIQDCGVSFGNVKISHSVLEERRNVGRSVSALYLLHPMLADKNILMNIQGNFAAAVKGNNSATARFLARGASVSIDSQKVLFPTIERCLLEVSGAKAFLAYSNLNVFCDDFVTAYVLLSNKAEVYCSLQNAELKKVLWDLNKEKQRLFIIKNLSRKVKITRCRLWPFLLCR